MYYYALILFTIFLPSFTQTTSLTRQNAFSIDEAYTQLMYAYSAYCPTKKVQSWDCYFCSYNVSDTKGFKVASVIEHRRSNTFGYVGNLNNTVEVVFRGTEPTSLANWITDLNAVHTRPYPNVPNAIVHSGFLDTYDAVKLDLRTAVFKLIYDVRATKVVFTGHSLGAALITLAAADLVTDIISTVPNISVYLYNFGSPRVGNLAFANYLNSIVPTTYRITNRGDMVPHLPDELMGFHHIAQEVWWSTKTHYQVCDMTGEDKHCADSETGLSIPNHLDYLGIELVSGGC